MRITCTVENLAKGINLVSKISTSRGSLPVLSNILIKAEEGIIILAATDLELAIKTEVTGKVEVEGSITVPARLINEYINTINDEYVTLELEGEVLKITSDHYNSHLNGLDASEFPLIPEVKSKPTIKFPTAFLKEGLSQVVFAASRDETRPILTGINFILKEKELKLVSTDSYRLAEKTLYLEEGYSGEISVIVPVNTTLELLRIITTEDEFVEFYISDNQVMFTLLKTKIVSRIIEGKYPEYEKIIPTKFSNETIISKQDFTRALKMTNLFARESANNVKFKIKSNLLELVSIAPQVGDNTAKIETKSTGEEMEIAFNTKYLLDAMSQIAESKIIFKTNVRKSPEDRLDPGMMFGEGVKSYRYIIMPLQLDD